MTASTQTLSRLAAGLVGVTWCLLVFGSTVRANGAGLACPDWPLCFGEVVPALDMQVFLEWGHRVLAGGVSLGFVGLSALVLARPELRARLQGWLLAAAVVLAVQVVLGGLTVLQLLAEWTVVSHLTAGNTFCLLLLCIALRLRETERPVARRAVSPLQRAAITAVAVAVPLQLIVGGLVSSSGAGLACVGWPECNGAGWFPTWDGLIGLHVAHRTIAYSLLGLVVATAAVTRGRDRIGRGALALLGLVLAQIGLGIANVTLYLPVEVTILHSAGAATLVLATTWLVREAWLAPLARASAAPTLDLPVEAA